MKKSFLIVLAAVFIFSQVGYGQVKWNLEVGAGMSKSIVNNDYGNNKGIVSGVFGLYPSLTIDKFVIETGVEFLKSGAKSSYENANSNTGMIYSSSSKEYLSKINTPIQLGYTLKVGQVKFTPFMGLGLNFNINTYYRSESTTTPSNRSTKEVYRSTYTNRITKDHYLPTFQTQLIGGVNVMLTNKLKLYSSYSIGLGDSENNYAICCICGPSESAFIDYCGVGNAAYMRGELRFGVKYAMF